MMKTKLNISICLLLVFIVTACTAPVSPTATVTPLPPPTQTLTRTPTPTLVPTDPPTPTATETVTLTPDPAHTEDHILSDGTWLFTRNAPVGWKNVEFDDSDWSRAALVESAYPIPGSPAAGLWEYPYVYKQYHTLYFRKTFDVQVLPARARLVVVADDSVNVYLNGNMIYTDNFKNASYLELDVTQWLRLGKNVLALQGKDVGQGTAYVAADLGLCPADAPDRYPPFVYIMYHSVGERNEPIWLEAMDAPCDSGVTELVYRIDGGDWITMSPHTYFHLPSGAHVVEARASDGSGKQGFDQWTFQVK